MAGWFVGYVFVHWVLLRGLGLYVTTTAPMRLPMLERLLVSGVLPYWNGCMTWADWQEVFEPGAAVPTCAHLSLLGEGGKVVAE